MEGVVEEMQSITDFLNEVAAEMCNGYCKYPEMEPPEGKDENWLEEEGGICDKCPLGKLV